jgi:hypothetical protein
MTMKMARFIFKVLFYVFDDGLTAIGACYLALMNPPMSIEPRSYHSI